MAQRENWSGRSAFILAAIGSAVGLGNIWRFPYVAYENGGGAFLLPYLIALFTAAIPLLFLDYAIGHKYRGGAPSSYKRLTPSAESIGWWQTLVSWVIAVYYSAVIVWAGCYTFFSFGQKWGDDAGKFLMGTFLNHPDTGGLAADFLPQMFIGLVIIWVVALLIMYGGIRKGIEIANKICIPLLIILFSIMVFKAVNLPGASKGLNAFFTPNWDAMTDPKVWLAAYGHVFFSLSIGFGIMVTFASYLKRNTNLTGSGLVVAFANSSFEILAGIGIFSALGFMAYSSGQDVSEVATAGVGLAFAVFPQIISSMGESGDLFGFLFFGSLVVAGISSLVSILEVPIAAFQSKFSWGRKKTVTLVVGSAAIISISAFSTNSVLTLVDVLDEFSNQIGIVFGGLISIIWVFWFNRNKISGLVKHVNHISSFKLGALWNIMLTVVTPLALLITIVSKLMSSFTTPYGGYQDYVLNIFGWGLLAFFGIGAWILTSVKGKDE